MSAPVLGYVERHGVLHRLTGTSKLVLVLALVITGMITFDARLLAALSFLNIILWVLSRIRLHDLWLVLSVILVFMVLNNLLIYIFAPAYGTELFGTEHILLKGVGRWNLTTEQLFYQLLVTLKYFAVLPSVLLFIATTRPPEFAASLNRLGVPYRMAYAVSLALRYIPDIQREFATINQAQQARGLDTSKNVKLGVRIRNLISILMPLLLSSLDRIETIAAAMELRGFSSGKRRTWYAARALKPADWLVIGLSLGIFLLAVALWQVNSGRFWNPFTRI
ncbi:energy-coupling factor transporter transmembrane component T family protein [Boudabousia marimammalium]|uniref:Cobalt ABC transporter permease n=1 Tax=Boudabousia marimammalium TaxID=156892 RepID=A0A1Q5PR19_9ACTO|nr:energy-coupling factor transporter transmembrane component T [Boudabousia marimammalium]OKL49919.1 hypothetical protein BM477_03155 [Boudabousia marimammalium]